MIRINGKVVRGWGLEDPTLDRGLEVGGGGARAGHKTWDRRSRERVHVLIFSIPASVLSKVHFALLCFVLFLFFVLFCFCFVLFVFLFCFALLCVLSVTIHVLK